MGTFAALLDQFLNWLRSLDPTIRAVAAPFALVAALAGFVGAGWRARKWWIGRRAHVRKLLDFLTGEPVLFAPPPCEAPGPTYGAAQKIRNRISRLLPKVTQPDDRDDFDTIREACITLKNSFPDGQNLRSIGGLTHDQEEALEAVRRAIAERVENLCRRYHIEIPLKFLPYLSQETRTVVYEKQRLELEKIRLKKLRNTPSIATSRGLDVDQQLAIFNKPGAIVRIKWEPAKRHGITEYGTVIQAYKSRRLWAEKDHVCVVFNNALNSDMESALLDSDTVELLGNPV